MTGRSSDSTVRRFQPGDGPDVRRVHRAALRAAGTDPDDVPGNQDLRWIEETYLRSGGEFLVAERDGRVVACGGLLVEGETAELMRIAVDPAHQRAGYGTAILDGLEATAAERGCARIVLTTADRQAAAKQFYPDRGYERRDERRVNGYELIEFEKSLSTC
ncbi:Acetyltransferase (GNAT) family [Halorhabdus sp. SVX81]|uniref:GNAT family N-acetyltransferase n=1 Tax=Halorhabdus sp. SVX81 TaxID=2978283 RepID=UPI0023DCD046|nr:GNAT family N-acetyltransferase [Halorhabdus sp. SVX81]WEL16825.1 Acetyltransferase (GNAT) family [Halorhabdus sp. SVX81]